MSAPLLHPSSSPMNLPHSHDSSPKTTTTTTITTSIHAAAALTSSVFCSTSAGTHHIKDNNGPHHHYTALGPSDMSMIPELILSSLLQSQCNLPQSPIMIQPIHHTLENATITYDTLIEQQKQLVKDVFFSPAMPSITDHPSSISSCATSLATMSLSASPAASAVSPSFFGSICSDDDNTTFCGSQTDSELTCSLEDDFSPSDLLLDHDDSLLFFGALDFDLEHQQLSNNTPSLLETPTKVPHSSLALKRKRDDTLLPHNKKHEPWSDAISPKSTPPMSPNQHRWDYFDTSGEDSSSEDYEDHGNEPPSVDYHTMNTEFQHISVQDDVSDSDNDSLSSWENRRATMFDITTNQTVRTKKLALISKKSPPKVAKKNLNSTQSRISKKKKQHKKMKPASTPTIDPETNDHLQKVDPRPTCHPTLYQTLTKANVDWCRYCGTTEGVNWRPGPWGKRTLCNKHGCDYKGYGFACKLPRLDLTGYVHESLHHRDRPVLQFYCATCHRMESWATNVLVRCEGCYKSYHQKCYNGEEQPLSDAFVEGDQPWYCDAVCRGNVSRRRVVVEISRKRLPLMCVPNKNQENALSHPSSNSLRSPLTHRATRTGDYGFSVK